MQALTHRTVRRKFPFGIAASSVIAIVSAIAAVSAGADPGYLRYPDIHGDRVVVTAEGDLWITLTDGTGARRLTTHAGQEGFARFSPDGSRIAFTGDYDGNRDLFVVPTSGGEPKRLTWHPWRDEPVGWTPDGKRIIFRSRRESPTTSWELFTVSPDGGDPEKLPLGWAARIAIDRQSGLWAFNRLDRDFSTWKRYRGGTAQDIWVGHPDRADFRAVTTFEGTDAFPMWHDGRIFFASDKGGTTNIWSMKPDGSDRVRHTNHTDWDVRWPEIGPDGRIVFMLGGDIHLFDPADGSERALPIDLPSERLLTRKRYSDADKYLTWYDLAPEADRLLVVTRGELFSVPVEEGVTLPITHGSGSRENWGSYSPDGKRIVYVTDENLEEAIVTVDAWGRGDTKIVRPAGESGWHFPPVWSPDGKWMAYADQTYTLYVIPSQGGEPKVVDKSDQWEIREYCWSPDGRWLAYTKIDRRDFGSIYIYDVLEESIHRVTGETTDDGSPGWDPDGRYLYFLSDRTFDPVVGSRDLTHVVLGATKPYMVLLRADVKNPFAPSDGLPPDDTGEEDADEEDGDEESEEDEDEEPTPVEIEFDGLTDRVIELPVSAGRYQGLEATRTKVFYLSFPPLSIAERHDDLPQGTLMAFDLEEKEANPFMESVGSYDIARKAGKIAVMRARGEIYVVGADSPPENDLSDAKVSLDGIVIELDPRDEWRQIYYEGWRYMRDFHWDPSMSGLDWPSIRDRYARLLPRISTRDDLEDLLGEVIGELSTSHTYIWGGDPGVSVPRRTTGLLGADLSRVDGAFRVSRIYRADPADNTRSPLDEPGVGIKEGDHILAVNHVPVPSNEPFEARMENEAGKPVLLTVNDRASMEGARDVVVTPLGDESELRYADWVRRNRQYVTEKTDGKIGYIHIPDMDARGLVAFDTWFYPQLGKEGMIVDVRWNAGGFTSQILLERFRRKVIAFDNATRGGGIDTYPLRALNGPFVVLTNEFAGSDGDIFPAAVQLEGLAPVIGQRSWGGVVGIRGGKSLVDQGMLTQPEFAWWDPAKGWGLENRGVEPDILVQNLPQDMANGIDAQLDRAIEEVLKRREAHPPVRPELGPRPHKTREAYQGER